MQRLVSMFSLVLIGCLGTACGQDSSNPGLDGEAANLSSLELIDSNQQPVGLSPSFDSHVASYVADVGDAIESLTVTVAVPDPGRTTVRLQGPDGQTRALDVGQGGGTVPLSQGANTLVVIVEASGSTQAYRVTVIRGTNASVNALALSAGGLSPAFAPAVTAYTVATGLSTETTRVTATLSDAASALTINGAAATSGVPSPPIPLSVGATAILIGVRAQNETTKTYTVVATRADTSALRNLAVEGFPASPAFDPNVLAYVAGVPFATTSVNVVPTVADSSASITVNQQPATSGQPTLIALDPGSNLVQVVVRGPSVTPRTYLLTITRAPASANANLANLTVSPGTLSPGFSPTTLGYLMTVGGSVAGIQITATPADSAATLTINGQPANSGQGVAVLLTAPAPSTTVIPIVVTAQNGAVQTYSLTVNRAALASSNANLASLALPPASVSFSPSTLSYVASVPNTVTAVTVHAAPADPTATMTVNSQPVASPSSFTVPLNQGMNEISIRVTAPAGNVQTYVVTITRLAPPASQGRRILPLGDSITQSDMGHLSYRYYLWRRLIDAGVDFDFVGSLQEHVGGTPAFPTYAGREFDREHEGHSGWRVDDILNGQGGGGLASWLQQYDVDVALIHLGTNDLVYYGEGEQSTLAEMRDVIRVLREDNPAVTVLLAQIIPTTFSPEANAAIARFNGGIPALAAEMTTAQSPVRVVDLNSGFDASTQTYDGVHPNAAGEAWMADRWWQAIQ